MDKVEFLKDEAVVTQLGLISKHSQTDYYRCRNASRKRSKQQRAITARPIYNDLKERFARKPFKKIE